MWFVVRKTNLHGFYSVFLQNRKGPYGSLALASEQQY